MTLGLRIDMIDTDVVDIPGSMSNSHLKCPTHVQLDTRVRQTRWIKIVETPGRSSTGLCTDSTGTASEPCAFEMTRTAYRTRLVTDGIRREEIPRARE